MRSIQNLTILAFLLGGALRAATLIYEPFDDLDLSLNGNETGLGLTGTSNAAATIDGANLSYGSLSTSGGHATAASSNFGENWANPGTSLIDADLMADGATLWFSALVVSDTPIDGDNGTARAYNSIGNASLQMTLGGSKNVLRAQIALEEE